MLRISGSAVQRSEVLKIHERVKELTEEGVLKIIIDVSSLKWVGSPLLGALGASYASLSNMGGDFRLTGVTSEVRKILAVTGLSNVFPIGATVNQALADLRSV